VTHCAWCVPYLVQEHRQLLQQVKLSERTHRFEEMYTVMLHVRYTNTTMRHHGCSYM